MGRSAPPKHPEPDPIAASMLALISAELAEVLKKPQWRAYKTLLMDTTMPGVCWLGKVRVDAYSLPDPIRRRVIEINRLMFDLPPHKVPYCLP